ncbi:aspartyl-phosphate phosphatase Spo0E family protein [Clostridiaceae bacterium 35-E11]
MHWENEIQLLRVIEECRERLGQLMLKKNMQSDEELIRLSQELDRLIAAYYQGKISDQNRSSEER